MVGRMTSPTIRRLTASCAAVAAALCAFASTAQAERSAGTVTKTAGAVTATLSWDAGEFAVSNPRLVVSRAGVVTTDVSVADACRECILVEDSEDASYTILHVADLDADGEPEVFFDVFSGGAHCCTTTRFYTYRPATNSYRRAPSYFWGNAYYEVVDLDGDGRLELSGSDDRFAYAFASYAGSAFPPLILRYGVDPGTGRSTLTDVTRRFPSVIRADAARLLKIIRKAKRQRGFYEYQGAIAAYVADEYLLHRGSVGKAEVRRARRRGLTTRRFEGQLLVFLRKLGYR
jgi:hypothetical protein